MTVWVPNQIIVPGTIDPIAVQWGSPGGAAHGDTFQPILSASLVDHSIQCEGTFGVGTSVTLTGSNDATNITNGHYHALHDPFSNVINLTQAGIAQSTEITSWIAPAIVSGDGTESLTITVAFRRSVR